MKRLFSFILLLGICVTAQASDQQLESYISDFNYAARKEMKMDSKGLIQLLKEGKAQLIDIRFPEEYAAWKVGPSKSIPLNELPTRLGEIDKTKVVRIGRPLPWFICAPKESRQSI